MLSQCFKSSRIPGSEIFIYFDDVHQSRCVSFRSFTHVVRSFGTESIGIQPTMTERKNEIKMFKVIMIVRDLMVRFGHSIFGIAPSQALDAHQPNAFTVQVKLATLSL